MDKNIIIRSAQEFAQRFNSEGIVPFPFQNAISRLGDINLNYLETSNVDVSGAVYLEDGIYTIVINSAKPPKRQYFTLAHEIGHYCLHKDKLLDNSLPGFIDFGSLDNSTALFRPDSMPVEKEALQMEREANTFAAEIIMPGDKVKEFYALNGDIKDTADAFQVSAAAMAVRLEKLGLA